MYNTIHSKYDSKQVEKYLTDFYSGERIVNDADQHPSGFQRVGGSIDEEAPRLLLGCFDQHISPVQVPAINSV